MTEKELETLLNEHMPDANGTWRFLTDLEIEQWFGPQCPDYEEDCAVCSFWTKHIARRRALSDAVVAQDYDAALRWEFEEMAVRKEMVEFEYEMAEDALQQLRGKPCQTN